MKTILGLITGLFFLNLAQPIFGSEAVGVILHNGSIFTMNDKQPEVEAIAVKEGRIVASGDEVTVLQKSGSGTSSFDLLGKTLLQGFFDSHGKPVCGDGCFNHGLSVFISAIQVASG